MPPTPALPPDAELIAQALSGNQGALDQLLRRHYDTIHTVCTRIAGSTQDGDDATQEALLRIVRNLHRFDGRAAFSTWAYRVASNAALDEIRKRKRRPSTSLDEEASSGSEFAEPDSELPIDSVGDRLLIEHALGELPEQYRIPVVLRDVAGMDYAAIAETIGVPVGTVKSRIARGRHQLAEFLRNQNAGSERPTREPPPTP